MKKLQSIDSTIKRAIGEKLQFNGRTYRIVAEEEHPGADMPYTYKLEESNAR